MSSYLSIANPEIEHGGVCYDGAFFILDFKFVLLLTELFLYNLQHDAAGDLHVPGTPALLCCLDYYDSTHCRLMR